MRAAKDYRFNVFVEERYTPALVMTALYNTLAGMNEFGEDNTYRLSGKVEMDGGSTLSLATMQSSGDANAPAADPPAAPSAVPEPSSTSAS